MSLTRRLMAVSKRLINDSWTLRATTPATNKDLNSKITTHMFSANLKTFAFTFLLSTSALAQCLLNSGYLGAYDATTGAFVGAVAKAISPASQNILTLETNANVSNYLTVEAYTQACNDGGPAEIKITNPLNPAVPFLAPMLFTTNCKATSLGLQHQDSRWLALCATDGAPQGPYPKAALSQTTCGKGPSNVLREWFYGRSGLIHLTLSTEISPSGSTRPGTNSSLPTTCRGREIGDAGSGFEHLRLT
ncbi:hypothetical protein MIND_01111200 [Mycena indigotica]|uniref:Uncharacterized protein n=1 Tax=Mycena indigotica TaxID=2126181 RepID=A0A8H6SA77_9AGAR|nr:uncharacterized protein MIND_01111200 [Mycena indigotica]KAF7295708.1 hypothetical protein MIND_01111200 [Mycena indigotica]